MKVLILAVLLVSICCLEGAVVKQQAEEPTPSESQFLDNLGEALLQSWSNSTLKGIFDGGNVNDLKTLAHKHLLKLRGQFFSVTEQLSERARQFFENWQNMSLSPHRT